MDSCVFSCGYVLRLLSLRTFTIVVKIFWGTFTTTAFICFLFVLLFQDKLKKITVFGAGLLVGTALAVIIPEGVRSLVVESAPHASNVVSNSPIGVQKHDDTNVLSVIGYCLVLGFIFMLIVDQVSSKQLNERRDMWRRETIECHL